MSQAHVLVYTPTPGASDIRSCDWIENAGTPEAVALYQFRHFRPPDEDNPMAVARTVFARWNINTGRSEGAGEINWGRRQDKITFGINEETSIRDMRQIKTPGKSKSRRFSWNGHQYKWKLGATPNDLQCYTVPRLEVGAGKLVASYDNATQSLTIDPRGEQITDQIVVLCVIHMFMMAEGRW